jgi:PIN like domain
VAAARVAFLFDANLPPGLVRALREELGENAYHVGGLLQPGAPDEEVLRYAGERAWCTVSADRRMLHRPNERAVISELGIGAFFLNDSVKGFCTIVRAVMHNWPEMKRIAATQRPPFLYLVRPRNLVPVRRKHLG